MAALFPDIQLLKTKTASDERGNFVKFYDDSLLGSISFCMQQMNYVQTKEKYMLRGLHYQTGIHAEAKIFRVLHGAIQLGFLDTRKHQSQGQASGSVVLDSINQAYYIPRGYATGYLTLATDTTVLYMSDNNYSPTNERGIRPNDPCLDIAWQTLDYQTSSKDKHWPDWK